MSYVKQDEGGGGDTYTLRAAQSGADVDIQLDAATGSDSDVKLKAGTNITLTEASDTITIDAAGGSPGGSNTQVQFNDGGTFGGDAGLQYNKTNNTLGIGTAPNPVYSMFAASNIKSNGQAEAQRFLAGQDGSASSPRYSRTSDQNTGMYFAAADELAFTTGGNERLRLASSGQIGIGGANYGSAGQVLTSQGAGSAPTWSTPGPAPSPVPISVGTGLLVADPFTFTAGSESNYPLWANINSTNSSAWSGFPSTTQAVFMPFQVPKAGSLAELCFRTGNITSGGTLYMAVYAASGVTNLPLGAPLFSTNFALSSLTEFEFAVSGVTGLVAGDILYISWLGYTGMAGDIFNVGFSSLTGGQSGGYALNFPRRITGSNLQNFVGRQYTALRIDGITPNTFPTVSATQSYAETLVINTPLNMSARYS